MRTRVIFLTSENPFLPAHEDGSRSHLSELRTRNVHLLECLREKADVEVLCFARQSVVLDTGIAPAGVRITAIRREAPSRLKRVISALGRFDRFGLRRWFGLNRHKEAMAEALRNRAEPGALLWISRQRMAEYIPLARSLGYRVLFDESLMETRRAIRGRPSLATNWKAASASQTRSSLTSSHAVIVPSEIQLSRLQKLIPNLPIHVIPYTVDSSVYENTRKQSGNTLLVPIDLGRKPELDGLAWFLAEVYPRLKASLREQIPEVVVHHSGSTKHETHFIHLMRLHGLSFRDIQFRSQTAQPLTEELGLAALVMLPVRGPDGTARGRILEAMAAGRAVITTGRGAEGLVLTPAHDIFIADHPDAFASDVLRLLRDPEMRRKTGLNAFKTVQGRYDWRSARPLLHDLMERLAISE